MLIYNHILICIKQAGAMAKSGFKAALRVAKTIDREIKKSARAAERRQRQQEADERKLQREHERRLKQAERDRKAAEKSLLASKKAQMKAELEDAKNAYAERCEDRKVLREQFINEEIK
jgi:hypothetical protein